MDKQPRVERASLDSEAIDKLTHHWREQLERRKYDFIRFAGEKGPVLIRANLISRVESALYFGHGIDVGPRECLHICLVSEESKASPRIIVFDDFDEVERRIREALSE